MADDVGGLETCELTRREDDKISKTLGEGIDSMHIKPPLQRNSVGT